MKTSKLPNFVALLASPWITQCVIVEPEAISGGTATQLPGTAPSYGQPLTAEIAGGSVIIREGGRVLSSFRTASPNVEQTRWRDGQELIVVKSRGNHGPATVQMFNSRNGNELARVMAYDIRDGQPDWAYGMGE